ncbi:MAG: zinc-ribbon domain-containing protein [Liquorilactobacillus ghanensis]|jgi:uncharacterized membrane protein YhaH (DUF805 family)/RNA polymerase subunit RPABC4/transcription elongation factor Spt4|uniref:DZANK-type domain-containing protein n=1 Tax=Liquorilactobacillus ghanensis DSM 18630 TaxID=1423750 RepID=A0A0R1VI74_9LACO|nr:zinc-ribbon domain-containing protein [Liquorilactobacillus ghanensis]KRM05504.1 hypothetical protein FC89_GL001203 [Liquorilactobacillus ghanensis DSM 18630]
MKYCQRCGRKIANETIDCPHCGIKQENPTEVENKHCKKCDQLIPVNANYCTYCGADQAFFYHDDQQKTVVPPTVTPEPAVKEKLEEDTVPNRLQKNESSRPGLIISTKLMIHDIFTISKRMGRADYWWGFLGLNLLSVAAGIIIGTLLSLVQMLDPQLTWTLYRLLLSAWLTFIYITVTTAQIRRLHDCEWSGWLILAKFIFFVGDIFIIYAMLQPQSVTQSKYTFKEKNRSNHF